MKRRRRRGKRRKKRSFTHFNIHDELPSTVCIIMVVLPYSWRVLSRVGDGGWVCPCSGGKHHHHHHPRLCQPQPAVSLIHLFFLSSLKQWWKDKINEKKKIYTVHIYFVFLSLLCEVFECHGQPACLLTSLLIFFNFFLFYLNLILCG